jgi:hypothetical protein
MKNMSPHPAVPEIFPASAYTGTSPHVLERIFSGDHCFLELFLAGHPVRTSDNLHFSALNSIL